jgi:polar amino acid transport system substrate-binding protein
LRSAKPWQKSLMSSPSDESMEDDFRNHLWKGHYLGGSIADVMMHVPVDPVFAKRNDEVTIFGPYHHETVVMVYNPLQVGRTRTLDGFINHKIGVEILTLPSDYLLSAFGGRLQENVVHFRTVAQAAQALRQGQVAGVMAPRGELEAALGHELGEYSIGTMPIPGIPRTSWDIGRAVKSDNGALASALGKAISELRRDGTIQQIFAEYGISHKQPQTSVFKTAANNC